MGISQTILFQEVDDDMFWDYGPQNPSKDTPVSKPASERKSNGTGNGRQAVSQKASLFSPSYNLFPGPMNSYT